MRVRKRGDPCPRVFFSSCAEVLVRALLRRRGNLWDYRNRCGTGWRRRIMQIFDILFVRQELETAVASGVLSTETA
jgi:hypothetical protein